MQHAFALRPAALVTLALAPALALAAGPASAQSLDPDGTVPSQAVGYHDLDLTTAQGRATLDRRIAAAARRVCGYGGALPLSVDAAMQRQCYDTAIARAHEALAHNQQDARIVRR